MVKASGKTLDVAISLVLAAAVAVTVVANSTRVGLTRDEGYYFQAAESYARWFELAVKSPKEALTERAIRRHFEVNREHPVLVKNLMALSYLAFAPKEPNRTWPPKQRGGYVRAMRLPAALFSALAVVLVFLLGRSIGNRRVGLLASMAFILAPRHFYHAGLACLDMPACATWLLVVLAWRKGRDSVAWSILTGLFFGIAISTKHNGWFLLPVLGLHWLVAERRGFKIGRDGIGLPPVPLALVAMVLLGPPVFFAHWPFLWHHTLERLGWYFSFHLHHVNYYWEYFGTLLTDPPFPWLYPFAVTAVTLPLATLVLA
ncbi:MAG: phospholipid carrier-dependent glycosyltransferase, partial [Deltaproteobacteria bacterium]